MKSKVPSSKKHTTIASSKHAAATFKDRKPTSQNKGIDEALPKKSEVGGKYIVKVSTSTLTSKWKQKE